MSISRRKDKSIYIHFKFCVTIDTLFLAIHIYIYMYACQVTSVRSDSLWPYGPWSARLLCSWDSLGKNTGVDCHFLLWESSWPRDRTHVSCIGRRILYHWATLWLLRSVILLFAEPPKLTNKTGTLLLNQQLHQTGECSVDLLTLIFIQWIISVQ